MTSGTFRTVPISSIIVNRAERQRRELTNIEELAKSIADVGLIHPPVIRRDGTLVVGERRLTAMQLLGWTDVPVQFIDELNELELQKVELEENVRRVELSWQDRVTTVKKYHDLCAAREENWSHEATAQSLGFDRATISKFLGVAAEIEAGNELVINADKLSTAKNITTRKNERERAQVIRAVAPAATATKEPPLLNTDFTTWAKDYEGEKFNLIHCDFPYGVGMHESDQGGGQAFGTYKDSADVYWQLLEALRLAMDNVVHESAHLIFWFSMDFFTETKALLEAMGWKVNPRPLIWMKSDNTGIIPDANRGPRYIYESAFFASRGDRKLVAGGAVSNAFAYPGRGKSIHSNEKPLPMLTHFLRMVCDEYSTMLDPTAGSANAVKAAYNLKAGKVLGIERDFNFFALARDAFFED